MSDDIAILHDSLNTNGGAERVAYDMARTFDAPIYAMFVDESVPPDGVEWHELCGSLGQRISESHYMAEDVYQMHQWQRQPDLTKFDTLIVNKNNAGWYVPMDDQTTIWYLHSTPRNLYDRYQTNGGRGVVGDIISPIMRSLYKPNIRYADYWVCNSDLVARRLGRYWDVDADAVVYPPVDLSAFGHDREETGDYYVTVGRLAGHKRVDHIIQAANVLRVPLKVAGTGREYDNLADQAGPTVEMLGYVSEDRKQDLLSGAKGFIMAAENEDFGLTPIEAMASGTPVIGIRDGFTQYQIIDESNGMLYEKGDLAGGITRFENNGVAWGEKEIESWARKHFGQEQFRAGMAQAIREAKARTEVTTSWGESA